MISMLRTTKLRAICISCLKSVRCVDSTTNPMSKTSVQMSVRYSSAHEDYKKKFDYDLPPLMRFKPKPMPNLFYTLKNQFIVHFFLKPLIDKEFDSKNFLNGAKQALTVISGNLANDNIEGIKELVTEDAYEEISENFLQFTEKQKQLLKTNVEDILFNFIYDINIERQSADSLLVKIFVVFDILPDFQDILKMEAFNKDLKFFDFKKYLDLKVLCNYEFVRQYIRGSQKDWNSNEWVVSRLCHLKEKDVLRYYQMTSKWSK